MRVAPRPAPGFFLVAGPGATAREARVHSNPADAPMVKVLRSISVLVLSLLLFHFVTGTPAIYRPCDCCKADQEAGYGCNCPGCLAERGGLACYCSSQHKTTAVERKGTVASLKPIRCTCGSQDPVAGPQKLLAFIPQSGPAGCMIAPAGAVEVAEIPLALEDVALPRYRPG